AGPGHDPRQRRESARLRLAFAHQHHGGRAVIDARRVARGHRAVLLERRLEARDGVDRDTLADILVLIDDRVALAAGDRHRRDLVLEPAGLPGRLGLVLRGDGETVLLLARDLP